MTVRTRLTFWYAGILSLSLFLMGWGTYQEIDEQLRHEHRHRPAERALSEAMEMLVQVGLPALALGLAGGWWLTRRALAPVIKLTTAVQAVRETNLAQEIPRTGNGDELDRLTHVFNDMMVRLDDSFKRTREFTLHASHELKTPLTILCAEMETVLREDSASAAERDRVASQLDELRRLARIVDHLTLLAKADAGQVPLQLEPLPFDELVRDNFDDLKILAEPHSIQVRLSACQPAMVLGDKHRLRQMLLNLADNAIKHNRPNGSVELSLTCEPGWAVFTIQNSGPGIPPGQLPRVFDRFFRIQAEQTEQTENTVSREGSGLGLSIVRWIVVAHHGAITLDSVPEKTTIASLRLPLLNEGSPAATNPVKP